ncbi:unannotated protein [freshwater metagenome]|uniref:Unannotated protein n=1 Tax=freshwater metagenome TaxID=449393 RepID=A0A6J7KJ81_9ZZZZ
MIRASFIVSLIIAPVAYGVIVAKLSISSAVNEWETFSKYPSYVRTRPALLGYPTRYIRSIRPGRSSASSNASGIFVAMTTKIRYLGGFLGRMPKARLTTRLINPRGFFNPESSVSRAWRVPIPPPPPAAPPIMNLLLEIVELITSDFPGSDK